MGAVTDQPDPEPALAQRGEGGYCLGAKAGVGADDAESGGHRRPERLGRGSNPGLRTDPAQGRLGGAQGAGGALVVGALRTLTSTSGGQPSSSAVVRWAFPRCTAQVSVPKKSKIIEG